MILTERLRMAGAKMSNICYNLGNGLGTTLDPYTKKSMREAYEEWDAAKNEAREQMRSIMAQAVNTRKIRKGIRARRTRQKSL